MKKKMILFGFLIACSLYGCDFVANTDESGDISTISEELISSELTSEEVRSAEDSTDEQAGSVEESTTEEKIEESNRSVVATAIEREEDSRSVQSILSALAYVNAGVIQEARLETDSELHMDCLYVVAEDGTHFKILLRTNHSLDSVLNEDTNEWLITSEQ